LRARGTVNNWYEGTVIECATSSLLLLIHDFTLPLLPSKKSLKIHAVSDVLNLLLTFSIGFNKRFVLSSDLSFLVSVLALGGIKKPIINLSFAELTVGRPSKNMSPFGQLLK